MKKKVLILGAGQDQKQMYETAKRENYIVYGVDVNPQAYCRNITDRFIHLSTRNYQGIIEALGDEAVDCIISPASDASSISVYALSEHFNTHWKPSLKSILASSDKGYFLENIKKLNVDIPEFCVSKKFCELEKASKTIGYPIMIKPVDSSGSKGISFVNSLEKLKVSFIDAVENSYSNSIIVEKYIEGEHYSAEWFRYKGETISGIISEKKNTGQPHFITIQHLVPAPLNEDVEIRIRTTLDNLCKVFDIKDGPVNFDFILKENSIYMIELGARLAGNGMPSLVKFSHNIDTYKLNLDLVAGKNIWQKESNQLINYAALWVISTSSNGRLKQISGLDIIKEHPAFFKVELFKNVGDNIHSFTQSNQKLGYNFLEHSSLEKVRELLSLITNSIQVEMEQQENL